jgi:hypothetical protein
MKLMGSIQGHPMLILVDSGSTHSFLKEDLVVRLTGAIPLPKQLSVAVADGAEMSCGYQFWQALWEVQGYQFHSDMKILPLKHYDMVLGYDWLAQFSPMKIHWAAKWMTISYGSHTAVIQGVLSEIHVGSMLQVCQVVDGRQSSHEDCSVHLPEGVPPVISELLSRCICNQSGLSSS